jgi:hypothetical protein
MQNQTYLNTLYIPTLRIGLVKTKSKVRLLVSKNLLSAGQRHKRGGCTNTASPASQRIAHHRFGAIQMLQRPMRQETVHCGRDHKQRRYEQLRRNCHGHAESLLKTLTCHRSGRPGLFKPQQHLRKKSLCLASLQSCTLSRLNGSNIHEATDYALQERGTVTIGNI